MSEIEFNNYMNDQIERIEDYKQKLEEKHDREFTLEEAARRWVQDYAEHFRKKYPEKIDSENLN